MTVQFGESGAVFLVGDCPAEDADVLLQALLEHSNAQVNWAKCTSAHTAVIQVILAAGQVPTGSAEAAFLKDLIGPALTRSQEAGSAFPGPQ